MVLGTYNERENLLKLLPVIETILETNRIDGEILVVDDNSPDGTSDLVEEFARRYGNVRLLWRPRRMGHGSAFADGFIAAKGDVIVGLDTDFSHDPYDIPKFISRIQDGYDLAVASRYIKGGQYEVSSFQTLRKNVASRLGNMLIRILSRVPLHDFTTSFRAIRREVTQQIQTESSGNSFFMEFVVKAYRKGYRIVEVPIIFKDRRIGRSKLNLVAQSFSMLRGLLDLTLRR